MTAAPASAPTDGLAAVGVGEVPFTPAALRRLRWAVRATLTLGVLASVAANVLHARDNLVSQMIAAWPPCALLLTIELIARVPVYRRLLATVRLAATVAIAAIAAYISYTHMAAVALIFGESGLAARLLPISVDGLVIASAVSLVELTGRVQALNHPGAPTTTPAPAAGSVPAASPSDVCRPATAPAPEAPPPQAVVETSAIVDDPAGGDAPSRDGAAHHGDAAAAAPACFDAVPESEQTADGGHTAGLPPHTADAVAYWLRRDPSLQPADIATKLGRSKRTVRRYWPREVFDEPAGRRVNGHHPDLPHAGEDRDLP